MQGRDICTMGKQRLWCSLSKELKTCTKMNHFWFSHTKNHTKSLRWAITKGLIAPPIFNTTTRPVTELCIVYTV